MFSVSPHPTRLCLAIQAGPPDLLRAGTKSEVKLRNGVHKPHQLMHIQL